MYSNSILNWIFNQKSNKINFEIISDKNCFFLYNIHSIILSAPLYFFPMNDSYFGITTPLILIVLYPNTNQIVLLIFIRILINVS